MGTPAQRPGRSAYPPDGLLATTLATLAGTPDDASQVETLLVTTARLAADVVEPVSYASVTATRAGTPTTVAASSHIAYEVDLAQYADRAGPCLDALEGGRPVDVPDVGAVMAWPGFRDEAWRLGLRASLSIPLFAASGVPIAALNLYAHDPEPMEALTRRVLALYAPGDDPEPGAAPTVQRGSTQLLAGIAAAFRIRDHLQQAFGAIMARDHVSAETAYVLLRTRAAETGTTLPDAARTAAMEPGG